MKRRHRIAEVAILRTAPDGEEVEIELEVEWLPCAPDRSVGETQGYAEVQAVWLLDERGRRGADLCWSDADQRHWDEELTPDLLEGEGPDPDAAWDARGDE